MALLFSASGLAAQVNISAYTDKTALTLDDELTLTIQVTGASGNVVMPQLPSLPAFNVYSREVEQDTVNNETTLVFRYVMLPRFVGNATIGPVRFNYDGKTYQTDPIAIRIYRHTVETPSASAAAKPAPETDPNLPPLEASLAKQAYAKGKDPFFLISAVSDKNPYVNESFTLAVRFYYAKSFYDAPYQKPTVSNLFMEDEDTREGSQSINGTFYRYREQRYQLTAAAPGQATVGPASVRYKIGSSPLSAFDRLFGGSAIGPEKTALSSPITLQVRPVPADKPSSFYGAVGQGYTLSAKADPQQLQAGEAVNVTVTVKGPGNLKATQDLKFPALDGFKIYPAAAASGTLPGNNGALRSYKVFKAVFVPSSSGIYTLPAMSWSYFDPKTSSYTTLKTQPISLTVTPATQTEGGFDFAQAKQVGNGFQSLAQDIAYLKTSLATKDNLLERLSTYAPANWAAVALLVGCVLFTLLGRKPLEQKKAFAAAKARLKKATSSQEVADAVAGYLQQKFNISTASLPLKDILTQLHRHRVTPATAEAFSLLWQQLEADRFAPSGAQASGAINLPAQAQGVLQLMEEETR